MTRGNSYGYIKLYRQSLESRCFQNPGLWKVWTWCLLRANHCEGWATLQTGKGQIEVRVLPGQFIFGRHSAAKELSMNPSTLWKRILKLKNMQNLNIESNSQYSIISIVNWDTYQQENGKSNSQSNKQVTGKEQASNTNKNEKNEKNEKKKNPSPDFSFIFSRYSADQQKIIHQVFKAIKSTRKSGKVSNSVFENILKSWERFTPEQVVGGCRVYLGKNYAEQDKDERYLLGIIRGQAKSPGKPASRPIPPPKSEILTCEKIKKMKESRHEPSSTE